MRIDIAKLFKMTACLEVVKQTVLLPSPYLFLNENNFHHLLDVFIFTMLTFNFDLIIY